LKTLAAWAWATGNATLRRIASRDSPARGDMEFIGLGVS
jgi:hypothetical protein